MSDRKRRWATRFHRYVANPLFRPLSGFLPGSAVLETVGRRSGVARRTPVGGRLNGAAFWLVSDHGRMSNYVRNIERDPHVRLRVRGRWREGAATLLPGDDVRARLKSLPRFNSAMVRLLGTELLTIRVDLVSPDGDDEAT
jgi:deazaflavin-dependent oxidoreductase (nitroreductase family)